MVICPAPPSWLGRPPYLMHGEPLRLIERTVALRLSLNGPHASLASLPFHFYRYPSLDRIVPSSGPLFGGTLVAIYGHGLAVYHSMWSR